MTETKAPSPVWDFLKGLTPSLNSAIGMIVAAGIAGVGTLWAAGGFTAAPPPPPTIEIVKTVSAPNPVLETCQAAEQAVHTFRAEFHARFPERKVRGKRKATAAK